MDRSQSTAQRRMARAISPEPCGVCGGSDVAIDEVFERGLWLLHECRRCQNQWTEGPLGSPRGPVARAIAMAAEQQAAA
ncbi:MAG: hypothetical protein H6Q91_2559 [Deltaproteobacteria bacterium]|nr:hypothetical protein [Deltaproteobacteria bacterium]